MNDSQHPGQSPAPSSAHATPQMGRFDLHELAAKFPATAKTMLLDTYLSDTPEASVRLFRPYREVRPHYHVGCDEVLYVLSGKGTFWMRDPSETAPFGPGQLLIFPRRTVHAMPSLLETPVVFLAIDTPRRAPDDIIFVDSADGTASDFIAAIE
nr:cupin domain-containing protein [Beijerinckia mobilis]